MSSPLIRHDSFFVSLVVVKTFERLEGGQAILRHDSRSGWYCREIVEIVSSPTVLRDARARVYNRDEVSWNHRYPVLRFKPTAHEASHSVPDSRV
jgi:hypothetical protein